MGAVISHLCEGIHHQTATQGHDGGPARYVVSARCPGGCGWSQVMHLCAGRVNAIQASDVNMECSACSHASHWSEFWESVRPLASQPRARRSAQGSGTRPLVSAEALVTAFTEYLESRGRAAGTIDQRVRHVRLLERTHPELATVTPEQLDAWVRAQAKGKAPATTNTIIKSVRVFYGWADRFGVIRPNPATLLDLVPNPHRMGRIADDDALDVVLANASPQLRAMLLLGRRAGLRLSEITTLHTDALAGDWLTIIGKGSKQRRIFVVDDLRDALAAIRPAAGGYFFPGRFGDGPLRPDSVSKIITRETGFNPHSLRHAAASASYEKTKDLRATQTFLGHSNPNTTSIYVHVDDAALERAARAAAGTSE